MENKSELQKENQRSCIIANTREKNEEYEIDKGLPDYGKIVLEAITEPPKVRNGVKITDITTCCRLKIFEIVNPKERAPEEKVRTASGTVRQKRKERGLCTVCGKRPLVTLSYCEECRISENNYKKTRWNVRHKEAKSQGKCTICFYNLPRDGMATCIECSQENKRYHKKLKAQGKCLRCCKRNDGSGIYCIQCNKEKNDHAVQKEYSRKRYEKAKGEGTCIYCHKLSAKAGKVRCEACTKSAASGGSVVGWINKFHLYLKMGGKCAMCGNLNLRVLVIDHVQYYNHHTANNGKIWNTLMLRAL